MYPNRVCNCGWYGQDHQMETEFIPIYPTGRTVNYICNSCGHSFGHDELEDNLNSFYAGMSEGIKLYAWWKDGLEYVGTCGTTLKKATEEIEEERLKAVLALD